MWVSLSMFQFMTNLGAGSCSLSGSWLVAPLPFGIYIYIYTSTQHIVDIYQQVDLFNHGHLHVDQRCGPCRNLLSSCSIYIWAAESAGPKYARFFWFHRRLVVMHRMDDFPRHMLSGMSYHHLHYLLHHRFLFQVSANYIVSQFAVWAIDFPGGTDNSNVKWRALIWVISEVFLLISVSINSASPSPF